MRIKKITNRIGNDIYGILDCKCGNTRDFTGYNDNYFYDTILPNKVCDKCNKSENDYKYSFKPYRKVRVSIGRPVIKDDIDYFNKHGKLIVNYGNYESEISISEFDKKNGSPKIGDFICKNSKDDKDQWLVSKEYFYDNIASNRIKNKRYKGYIVTTKDMSKWLCGETLTITSDHSKIDSIKVYKTFKSADVMRNCMDSRGELGLIVSEYTKLD